MSLVFSVDGAKKCESEEEKESGRRRGDIKLPSAARFGLFLSVCCEGGGAVNIRGKSFQNKCLRLPLLVQCGRQ